jgi:hypothetical protein
MRIKIRAVEAAMKVSVAGGTGVLSAHVSVDGQLFFAGIAYHHEKHSIVLEAL